MTSNPKWLVKPPGNFSRLTWGEVSFLFDPASGQTHFLNEVSVGIIDLLSDGPMTATSLIECVLQRYGVDDDPHLPDAIIGTLGQLDTLGIVEQIP